MPRGKDLAMYHARYTRINGERSSNNLYWLCVYCGAPADTRDHVPPITRVCDYEAFNLTHEMYLLVPCCNACNSILSDSLQENILDRIEHLKGILSSRYTRRLKSQEWQQDEIAELGRNLRSHVAVAAAKDDRVRARVNYYGGFDAMQDQLLLEKSDFKR